MDILDYIAVWRRRWKTILAATLLGFGAAAAVCAASTPQYVASSQLFVTTTGGASVVEAYQGNLFGQERANSYAILASSRHVAQRAIDQLHIDLAPEALMARVTAEPVPNTVILNVSVSATNPDLARDLTNAVALQTTEVVELLETSARGGSPAATATLVDAAITPAAPASPQWGQALIVGGLAGVMLGLIAAIAQDKLLGRLASTGDAAAAADARIVGSVPHNAFEPAADAAPPRFTAAGVEAFRALRTSVIGGAEGSPTGALAVAGPDAGAGATTVSIGLATATAEVGRSVVIVDTDLHTHGLSARFGLEDAPGLADILAAPSTSAHKAAAPTTTKNVFVLPAGSTDSDSSELLGADAMNDVIKQLVARFDLVLLDGPPVIPYSDSIVYANWTDGVLLVAREDDTTQAALAEAAAKIRTARANIYGVVLTDAD